MFGFSTGRLADQSAGRSFPAGRLGDLSKNSGVTARRRYPKAEARASLPHSEILFFERLPAAAEGFVEADEVLGDEAVGKGEGVAEGEEGALGVEDGGEVEEAVEVLVVSEG